MSDSSEHGPVESSAEVSEAEDRRGFLAKASSVAMAGGLLGSYGAFAAVAGRFLYPAEPDAKRWMFVTEVARLGVGDSLTFRTPAGAPVNVARQRRDGDVGDFIALSSTCPHLGCVVKWEPHNDRFFCPCHNGVFDPTGKATSGPPAEAGQSLAAFRLKLEGGLLFIEVPTATVAGQRPEGDGPEFAEGAERAGHDPCLFDPPGERRGHEGDDPEERA